MSPPDEIVERYITEIANVNTESKKKKLEDDVIAMCDLLLLLANNCTVPKKVKQHFEDIYWSLRLHLVFHLGPAANLEKLEALRKLLGVVDQLPNAKRDQTIDPWSKLLEIVSKMFNNSA